jgi:hypothetical protein
MNDHRSSETVSLLLTCLNAAQCTVAFEPEGAVHILREGEVFTVELSGPTPGQVEVSFTPGGIVIGAWQGASTRLRNANGDEILT